MGTTGTTVVRVCSDGEITVHSTDGTAFTAMRWYLCQRGRRFSQVDRVLVHVTDDGDGHGARYCVMPQHGTAGAFRQEDTRYAQGLRLAGLKPEHALRTALQRYFDLARPTTLRDAQLRFSGKRTAAELRVWWSCSTPGYVDHEDQRSEVHHMLFNASQKLAAGETQGWAIRVLEVIGLRRSIPHQVIGFLIPELQALRAGNLGPYLHLNPEIRGQHQMQAGDPGAFLSMLDAKGDGSPEPALFSVSAAGMNRLDHDDLMALVNRHAESYFV